MRTLTCFLMMAILAAGFPALAQDGPAPEPQSPFKRKTSDHPKDSRPGYVLMSDGKKYEGYVGTTPGKDLRIYDRDGSKHIDTAFSDIASIEVTAEKDWVEQDWRWKEGGSDVKVFIDLWYRSHKDLTTVTLTNGDKLVGDCSGPINVTMKDSQKERLFLYKRHKGEKEPKPEPSPLLHIKKVFLYEPGQEPPDFMGKAKDEAPKEKPKEEPKEEGN